MSSKEEKIQSFIEVTGYTNKKVIAKKYIKYLSTNVERAINQYFESPPPESTAGGGEEVDSSDVTESDEEAAIAAQFAEDGDEDELAPVVVPRATKAAPKPRAKKVAAKLTKKAAKPAPKGKKGTAVSRNKRNRGAVTSSEDADPSSEDEDSSTAESDEAPKPVVKKRTAAAPKPKPNGVASRQKRNRKIASSSSKESSSEDEGENSDESTKPQPKRCGKSTGATRAPTSSRKGAAPGEIFPTGKAGSLMLDAVKTKLSEVGAKPREFGKKELPVFDAKKAEAAANPFQLLALDDLIRRLKKRDMELSTASLMADGPETRVPFGNSNFDGADFAGGSSSDNSDEEDATPAWVHGALPAPISLSLGTVTFGCLRQLILLVPGSRIESDTLAGSRSNLEMLAALLMLKCEKCRGALGEGALNYVGAHFTKCYHDLCHLMRAADLPLQDDGSLAPFDNQRPQHDVHAFLKAGKQVACSSIHRELCILAAMTNDKGSTNLSFSNLDFFAEAGPTLTDVKVQVRQRAPSSNSKTDQFREHLKFVTVIRLAQVKHETWLPDHHAVTSKLNEPQASKEPSKLMEFVAEQIGTYSTEEQTKEVAEAIKGTAITLTPKQHQLDSVAWMLQREGTGMQEYDRVQFPDGRIVYWHPLTGQTILRPKFDAAEDQYINPTVRGGILADEMGLGKTLCLLSVIALNPKRAEDQVDGKKPKKKKAAATSTRPVDQPGVTELLTQLPKLKATLVVVPVSLCGQWRTEIIRCLPTAKFLLFHGTERNRFTQEDFEQADIILTTYETLRTQLDKEVFVTTESERPPCGLDILAANELYLNHSPFAAYWTQALIALNTKGAKGKLHKLDPSVRAVFTNALDSPEKMFQHLSPSLAESVQTQIAISRFHFHRVIFDESQKVPQTGTLFSNLKMLKSTYQWVVSGTPVKSQYTELNRLLPLLGIVPFSADSGRTHVNHLGSSDGNMTQYERRMVQYHQRCGINTADIWISTRQRQDYTYGEFGGDRPAPPIPTTFNSDPVEALMHRHNEVAFVYTPGLSAADSKVRDGFVREYLRQNENKPEVCDVSNFLNFLDSRKKATEVTARRKLFESIVQVMTSRVGGRSSALTRDEIAALTSHKHQRAKRGVRAVDPNNKLLAAQAYIWRRPDGYFVTANSLRTALEQGKAFGNLKKYWETVRAIPGYVATKEEAAGWEKGNARVRRMTELTKQPDFEKKKRDALRRHTERLSRQLRRNRQFWNQDEEVSSDSSVDTDFEDLIAAEGAAGGGGYGAGGYGAGGLRHQYDAELGIHTCKDKYGFQAPYRPIPESLQVAFPKVLVPPPPSDPKDNGLLYFPHYILSRHMVRHIKAHDTVSKDLALPERSVVVHKYQLLAEEKPLYQEIEAKVKAEVEGLIRRERLGNRVSRVMQWVFLLRRLVIHPTLANRADSAFSSTAAEGDVVKLQLTQLSAEDLLAELKTKKNIPEVIIELLNNMCKVPPELAECAICTDTLQQPVKLECHHVFCRECVLASVGAAAAARTNQCPMCRCPTLEKPKTEILLKEVALTQDGDEDEKAVPFEQRAAKIDAGSKQIELLKVCTAIWAKEADAKIVVFSNEGSVMHRVKEQLKAKEVQSEVIDGSTTLKRRATIIETFQNPASSLKVCLLTARCGNAGLTLTAAHHLVLMEPSLNISMEQQAMGRIHRFGQTKPVTIHRLVALGTVEERTLEVTSGINLDDPQNSEGSKFDAILRVLGVQQ